MVAKSRLRYFLNRLFFTFVASLITNTMKTFISGLLFLFILSGTLMAQNPKALDGELLVQLNTKSTIANLLTDLSDFGITDYHTVSERFKIYQLFIDTGKTNQMVLLHSLLNNEKVANAQQNHLVTERGSEESCLPDDPFFLSSQWSLLNTGQSGGLPGADIDATSAWDLTTGGLTALGDTIVIAIVDGGSDINHEDVDFWTNRFEIPNNNMDDDQNGYIDDIHGWNAYNHTGDIPLYNHGIHVTGIAAATGNSGKGVTGINWGTRVMAVAGSSSTSEATVVEALSYIYTERERYNETNGAEGAFVVADNCSFGIDQGNPQNFPIWEAMYDSLGQIGVLSIAATANRDWNIDEVGDVPTAFGTPFMISVTNTTKSDVKFPGAGYGSTSIDLGAPGTIIMSSRINNMYGNSTGTSMATPHVTGAVALLYAAADSAFMYNYKTDPGAGALAIKDAILNGVDPLPYFDTLTVSGGRLNVFNAIKQIYQGPIIRLEMCTVTDSIEPNSSLTNELLLTNTGLSDLAFTLNIPGQPGWISVSAESYTVQPDAETFIQLHYNSNGLPTGTYQCELQIISNQLPLKVVPITLVVDTSVGLAENHQNESIQFYPNPFANNLKVNLSVISDVWVRLDIYNQLGSVILQQEINPRNHQLLELETTHWTPGIYFYRLISSDREIGHGKIIKE
jgi:subtilisin family serine protease